MRCLWQGGMAPLPAQLPCSKRAPARPACSAWHSACGAQACRMQGMWRPRCAARLGEEDGRLLLRVVPPRHLLQLVQQVATAQPLLRLALPEVSICQRLRPFRDATVKDSNPKLLLARAQIGGRSANCLRATP